MRWFKHLSASQDDEIMSELIDEFGPAGYGIWWIILEKLALACDETDATQARYSARRWAGFAGTSAQFFRKITRFLDEKIPNFCVEDDGRYIKIDCPNILKYRDEYTQKKQRKEKTNSGQSPDTDSGATPENVLREQRQTQSTETEGEQSTEKERASPSSAQPSQKKYVCAIPTQREDKPLRITKQQADTWQEKMQFVDVYGELSRLEQYFSMPQEERPKQQSCWEYKGAFNACFQALQKANQREMRELHARDPTFDPADPDGSKAAQADHEKTISYINRVADNKVVGGNA